MCGFCGVAYADPARPCDAERVARMRERLLHRGPDGVGMRTAGPVGLGHSRLSIIDVAGGNQPLSNEDGSVWIAFNGEIYNYVALGNELRRLGHTFRTRSDTEVLVHAYEEWGDRFVARLNGMFAFAIHDERRARLLLARDHLGIKPVFYQETDEGLFFGSEIKAVLAGAETTPAVPIEALQEYLLFRYVAWDRSFFEGVHRLPPGHFAVWESGRLSVQQYWSPADARPSRPRPLVDAVAELDELLRSAVEMQLMSEVPLGVFCSGGVDSGLVTRLAAAAVSPPLHTFSVGFTDSRWDETPLARDTASRAGTQHHVVCCGPDDIPRHLPRLVWHHDEPLSHPNSIPLAILSAFARERVTVVLTGEGPDEYLSGYPRHHIASARFALDAMPAWAIRLLGRVLRVAPSRRARLAGALLPLPLADSLVANSQYVDRATVAAITGTDLEGALNRRRRLAAALLVDGDGLLSINRYDLATYLTCALDRMDRMSMACGLEARVPFLDIRLVEWGLSLPAAFKTGGLSSKRVLKALAARYLSDRIVRGRKSGFGLPLGDWFRGQTLAGLLAPMQRADHPAASHFSQPRLGQLLGEHATGRSDHGEMLWLLANVYQWHELQSGAMAGAVV